MQILKMNLREFEIPSWKFMKTVLFLVVKKDSSSEEDEDTDAQTDARSLFFLMLPFFHTVVKVIKHVAILLQVLSVSWCYLSGRDVLNLQGQGASAFMMVSSTSPCSFATHITPTPSIFKPIPMLFSPRMSELNQFYFLTLHPQLSHSYSLLLYSWLHDFFFLIFLTIFPWQLHNFFWVITRPFYPMSKASITSSIISPKYFQHFMHGSLHLQHCLFSTSSTAIAPPHSIPCFLVVNVPPTHFS